MNFDWGDQFDVSVPEHRNTVYDCGLSRGEWSRMDALIREGKLIAAIKELRAYDVDLSLRKAKDIVEDLRDKLNAEKAASVSANLLDGMSILEWKEHALEWREQCCRLLQNLPLTVSDPRELKMEDLKPGDLVRLLDGTKIPVPGGEDPSSTLEMEEMEEMEEMIGTVWEIQALNQFGQPWLVIEKEPDDKWTFHIKWLERP